jgi:hypothetical protein
MRGLGRLITASALAATMAGGAMAQTVRPISPQTLRGVPKINRDALLRTKAQLRPMQIPLDIVAAAQPDMSGWTPVTKGGATGSPLLLPFPNYGIVGVRGKDKQLYITKLDLISPSMIDGGAWSLFGEFGQYSHINCIPADYASDLPNKIESIHCLFGDKGAKLYTQFISYWGDPELEALFEGAPPVYRFDSVEIPNAPGIGFWAGSAFDPINLVSMPIAAWDGNMGVATANIDTSVPGKGVGATWSKQPFYAYAPPACAPAGGSACVVADGVGDKVQVYWFDMQKTGTTIKLRATLPPIPGGGGMKQGEASIVLANGNARVFARGKDGKLYIAKASTKDWNFANWTSLGGSVAVGAIPSCITFKGGISCAIRATDNRIYIRRIPINTNGL